MAAMVEGRPDETGGSTGSDPARNPDGSRHSRAGRLLAGGGITAVVLTAFLATIGTGLGQAVVDSVRSVLGSADTAAGPSTGPDETSAASPDTSQPPEQQLEISATVWRIQGVIVPDRSEIAWPESTSDQEHYQAGLAQGGTIVGPMTLKVELRNPSDDEVTVFPPIIEVANAQDPLGGDFGTDQGSGGSETSRIYEYKVSRSGVQFVDEQRTAEQYTVKRNDSEVFDLMIEAVDCLCTVRAVIQWRAGGQLNDTEVQITDTGFYAFANKGDIAIDISSTENANEFLVVDPASLPFAEDVVEQP